MRFNCFDVYFEFLIQKRRWNTSIMRFMAKQSWSHDIQHSNFHVITSICWANISHARFFVFCFFRFIAAGAGCCWRKFACREKYSSERARARLLHVSTAFETLFATRFVRKLFLAAICGECEIFAFCYFSIHAQSSWLKQMTQFDVMCNKKAK